MTMIDKLGRSALLGKVDLSQSLIHTAASTTTTGSNALNLPPCNPTEWMLQTSLMHQRLAALILCHMRPFRQQSRTNISEEPVNNL